MNANTKPLKSHTMKLSILIKVLLLCLIRQAALAASGSSERPVSLKSITLDNGIMLEYAEQGHPNGLPVLLLHGFTDSWRSYEMVLPFLPSHLHVFSITLRGHGNSSKPGAGYEPCDFADDIAAFMRAIKLKSAVIVGHSMGSTIAQCVAVRYPELASGIVLTSALADFNQPVMAGFREFVQELTDPIDSAFIAEFQTGGAVRPVPLEQIKTFIAESMKVPAHVWKSVTSGWAKGDFTRQLVTYNKPVLIIWGEQDEMCTRSDQERLLQSLRYSTLIVYEGAGHAVPWEEPEQLALHLTKFVSMID
jgi:non-heme chloroperoxidase